MLVRGERLGGTDVSQKIDRESLQRVVAIINNKGGVGKTTLTTNIGGLLAESGWRVLIVDLDHQGNAGLDLGYRGSDIDDDGRALAKALQFPDEKLEPLAVRENLDVLIGGHFLEGAATVLSQGINRSRPDDPRIAVATILASISDNYDIVLLDCPPSSDVIQSAAVTAARYVLIPVKTDRASLEGLALTASRLDAVIDLNPDVELLGIVLFGTNTSSSKVRDEFIGQIVETLIEDGSPEEARDAARKSVFTAYLRHAEATANAARNKGVLVHQLENQVRQGPKWYEQLRAGKTAERIGPASAKSVADDLQAITQELVTRLTAFETLEEKSHV